MNTGKLSISAQDGLRLLGKKWENDELLFECLNNDNEAWAWWWFRLREMEDREEWFPKGKWATLQRIEKILSEEAKEFSKSAFLPGTGRPCDLPYTRGGEDR
jgi:hypothetical protein